MTFCALFRRQSLLRVLKRLTICQTLPEIWLDVRERASVSLVSIFRLNVFHILPVTHNYRVRFNSMCAFKDSCTRYYIHAEGLALHCCSYAMISIHMLTFRLMVTMVADFCSLIILIHNELLGEITISSTLIRVNENIIISLFPSW